MMHILLSHRLTRHIACLSFYVSHKLHQYLIIDLRRIALSDLRSLRDIFVTQASWKNIGGINSLGLSQISANASKVGMYYV